MGNTSRTGSALRRLASTIERKLILRFFIFGLLLALILFLASGGHLLFLPLFFVLPLGGLFGHRRRHGNFWYRAERRW